MPHPFWSSCARRNCAIQFNPDRNHLWKWIGINLDWIRIGRMRIQCERAQTGFDLVQCALGVQCEQAFSCNKYKMCVCVFVCCGRVKSINYWLLNVVVYVSCVALPLHVMSLTLSQFSHSIVLYSEPASCSLADRLVQMNCFDNVLCKIIH